MTYSIAANLIITEVTGKNRTNINGTVEIAGQRADLVMVNRNGIYVNGGNFLNTDRVTLTTGSLKMKNGDLVATNVTQGQIGIGEKGINALSLTDLELLGKTIDIAGVVKASKETRVLVSAGGQTYEYKTKEVKSKGETYKRLAIDGKAVGSMYAGKIDIISNDKGAGVNTKGDLVSVDDIVLTANGDITTAKVDSGKDLKYVSTQKVKISGETTAAKKVKVKSKETEINAKVITGYLEEALGKNSLSIESEKTNITAKIEAYGKVEIKSNYTQNNSEIFANEKINIVGNKLNNNNGEIRSQEKIEINTKETSNVKGYILSDGLTKEEAQNWKVEEKAIEESKEDKNKDDINEKKEQTTGTLVNTERLDNTKGIIASLTQTSVNIGKIINKDGKIVSRGAVELTTPKEYIYEGIVEGDYATTLNANKIIINDKIDRKNTLNLISEQEIILGQNIRAGILSIDTKAELRNTKDIGATNFLSITSKNIENSGNILSDKNLYLKTNDDLINNQAALIKGNQKTYIEAGTIRNSGKIFSEESLGLITDRLATNINGNIYSGGNVYIEVKNGDLINTNGGSINAAKEVFIDAKGKVINGTDEYLNGTYRREDDVLVDNRKTSEEKPSSIVGIVKTIIKAADFINTSQIGKTAQGTTYIELTGKGVNTSIGDNIAKIEGQEVYLEGNKGITNIGAIISGTELTKITSKNGKVVNESTIITTKDLTRTAENIRNIGKIEGNGIVFVEGKEIENIAGNIRGAEGTILKSTEGNIVDKTITLIDNRKGVTETYTEIREVKERKRRKWNRRDDDYFAEEENKEKTAAKKYVQVQLSRYWDTVDKTKTVSGIIGNGKDTVLDSAKDIILESSDIRAKDDIVLNAKNYLMMLSTVDTEYKFRTKTSKSGKWYKRKTKTETWIEDNIYANPVELTNDGNVLINYHGKGKAAENKGIFAQGVNFKTKGAIVAQSDGNIYIQGVKNKLNSIYDSHTSKKIFGFTYKRTSDYVSENREKYRHSQLYGDAGVSFDSQGRLKIEGVDVQTIGSVFLSGKKGVEILPGNEVNSRYEEHTSKGFKISGNKNGIFAGMEQNKNTRETDIIKSIGSIINSKGGAITVEGDSVVSIGSKIAAADDINLIGENGVILKDGENFAKINEQNEKMRAGMFASWSLKNISASAGIEAVYGKTDDGKTMVTPEKNIVVTNKNLYITSGAGNIFLQGDFGAKENIGIIAEKGKIYIKDSKSEVLTDSRSINARMALAFGLNLGGIKDTFRSYRNGFKALKEIPNAGRLISFTKDIARGKSLLESLDGREDTINAMNTLFAGPSSGNVSAGLDLTGSINSAKSTSKYLQNITMNIRAGNDILFKSKEFETEGGFIRAENDLTIDANKILIHASADKYERNSQNMGVNFGITFMGAEGVSAGASNGNMNSKGTLYNNSQIQAGNNLIVKADDMTVRGGRLEGKHTDVDVKGNLLIESLQDTEEMKQVGTNIGYSLKYGTAQDGTADNKNNGNLGLSYGRRDKLWVEEQSGIIGTESVKVNVGGKLSLIGSIIANIDEKGNDGGNLALSYGKLEVKDLDSYDKMININGSVEISQRSKDNNKELVINTAKDKTEDVKEEINRVDETYGIGIDGYDKHKITRATIGKGVINSGKGIEIGVNRDISKSDETLKNINVKRVEIQYKAARNTWGDFGKIMSSNVAIVGNFLDDFNEKALEKPRTDHEAKFRNAVYESILRLERKLKTVADFTSLLPTEQYHGGLLEQLVRRRDQVKLISIKVKANEDGTPAIKLERKERLSQIAKNKEGIVYVFGNGIREILEAATRNGILKSMSPENLEKYKRGETVEIALIYNPTRGLIGDMLESMAGKLFDGSWSSLKITTNVSKETGKILATRDRYTTYIKNMYSQGNIIGHGAFNWLVSKGIKLGYENKNMFLVGMFGSPVKRDVIAGFEDPLNFTFRGSAINFPDFIGNQNKWLGLIGETRLVGYQNIENIKESSFKDKIGWLPALKIFREQRMAGLPLAILNEKDKNNIDYAHSFEITATDIEKIKKNYLKSLADDKEFTKEILKDIIGYSHGTYSYIDPVKAEELNNLASLLKNASPIERKVIEGQMNEIYKDIHDYRLKLAIEGPPILEDSSFLTQAVEDYRKEELRKEYDYGNYQDKGLPNTKEMSIITEPYERKETPRTVDINEYLKSLREGVGL